MRGFALLLIVLLAACGPNAGKDTPKPPAKTELVAHETELLRITLTPEADKRLGIVVHDVGSVDAHATRLTNGEIVAAPPPGGVPVSAATDLSLLADRQAAAEAEIARSAAQAALAERTLRRAEALVAAQAGSTRSADEARAALAVANANLQVAQRQRVLLGRSPGALSGTKTLWAKASVYAGDLGQIVPSAPALVAPLGKPEAQVSARPVAAPPSADPNAATVDLYFALPADATPFRIGQRVSVALPVTQSQSRLRVPTSAIVYDIHGGTWVYVRTAPHSYQRRRVAVQSVTGDHALLARGLTPGLAVVSAGAAELFGVEFGAK